MGVNVRVATLEEIGLPDWKCIARKLQTKAPPTGVQSCPKAAGREQEEAGRRDVLLPLH